MSGINFDYSEQVPIVLFTGAGASCATGIELPNMTKFFQLIMDKNHNATHELIKTKDYFKYIMDCLYPDKGNAVYDLEKVLGTLYKLSGTFSDDDAFTVFNEVTLIQRIHKSVINSVPALTNHLSNDKVENAIKSAIDERYMEIKQSARILLHEIQMVIRETYSDVNEVGIYDVYGEFLSNIMQLLSDQNVIDKQTVFPIFTTNYDPSIDYVLQPSASKTNIDLHIKWRENNPAIYKFTDGFQPHEYGSFFVWRQEAFNQICEDGIVIPYHKLHGSVVWEKRGDEIMKTTDSVADLSEKPRNFSLIYPSDKSTPDDDPFAYSHRELERFLLTSDYLIVIGFAFRDPGLVNILKRALRNNNKLKIIIINPEPNEWELDFKEFLKLSNVSHVKGYFGSPEVSTEVFSILNKNKKVLQTS